MTPVAFQTNIDLEAPAGGGVQTVAITALEAGEAGNGAYGAAEPIDIVDGVDALDVAAPTSGGTEDETTDEYLARLAEALTILAPRPILPNDFSVLARQVPGVGRATTIDLYQPSTGQGGYGTPRGALAGKRTCRAARPSSSPPTTAARPTDASCSTSTTLLDASREVNFFVYVIAPGYDAIDVQATVRAYPGYDPAAVEAAAEAELAAWLDPGRLGHAARRASAANGCSTTPCGSTRRSSISTAPPACTTSRPSRHARAGGSFGTRRHRAENPGRAADARHVHDHGNRPVGDARNRTFIAKDWRNLPDTTTPITAEALEDMETRLAEYTDAVTGEGGVTDARLDAVEGNVLPAPVEQAAPANRQRPQYRSTHGAFVMQDPDVVDLAPTATTSAPGEDEHRLRDDRRAPQMTCAVAVHAAPTSARS